MADADALKTQAIERALDVRDRGIDDPPIGAAGRSVDSIIAGASGRNASPPLGPRHFAA
jgi:hypothetical protein